MVPYANFLFFLSFGIYCILPTVILGLFGRANAKWTTITTLAAMLAIFSEALVLHESPDGKALVAVRALLVVAGYALYLALIALAFLRWRNRGTFYAALGLSLLPLAVAKFLPLFPGDNKFGFLGISYVAIRALDVIFSIHDRVITRLSLPQYFTFTLFFPAISSGPVDRYRRFGQDYARIRSRGEFLVDLDAFVQRLFQGFLYKYIVAALLRTYWMDAAAKHYGFLAELNYMYAYTFYLFFDFAGYSAFAIGFGRLFGIITPENFDKPFLSRNIRDFWNRWHISLSFWFRDHIYMRFLLAASKGKWFKGKHTASYVGLFLTFGIMGIWHGPEIYYILYGVYHAVLLCGYDAFSRWNKQTKFWPDGTYWRVGNMLLTFHAIAFGLLLFSGHLFPTPLPKKEEVVEIDCQEISGWVWDADHPREASEVDVYVDDAYLARVSANEVREEKREQGFGNGAHGFNYLLPGWVRNGSPHTIDVRLPKENNRSVKGTPKMITCPVAE